MILTTDYTDDTDDTDELHLFLSLSSVVKKLGLTVTKPATTIDPKAIPRNAMQFAAARPMLFADGDSDTGILPFSMVARSAEAINHYYWGRIVHDFAGMILRRDSVTVDYAHAFDEVIGFANAFSVTANGLEVSGNLVTTEPNDKADEVYRKGKAGVPYEASIDWDGPEVEIEFIPDGVTTAVNDQQFAGPGYVVRKWPLRAIAICRYGCDPDTRTQFSKSESDPGTVSVSITSFAEESPIMAEATLVPAAAGNPTAPAAGADPKQFAAPQPGVITIDTLKQFSAEFGDKANEYVIAGLSIDAARYQFAIHQRDLAKAEVTQFTATVAAKDAVIVDLQTKLKQFGVESLGQPTPIDTDGKGPAAGDDRLQKFALAGGDNRAMFAAGMKLRGQ